MAFEWHDTLGPFLGATDRAIQSGLIAAAEVYTTEIKRRLLHGYTSGDFVTGNNVNHVDRDPECTPIPGGFTISVGSTQTNPPYSMYWELGFVPARGVFSPGVGSVTQGPVGVQRKEVWVPTMQEMHKQLEGVIAEEIKAVDG